jgi:hypothetical protein
VPYGLDTTPLPGRTSRLSMPSDAVNTSASWLAAAVRAAAFCSASRAVASAPAAVSSSLCALDTSSAAARCSRIAAARTSRSSRSAPLGTGVSRCPEASPPTTSASGSSTSMTGATAPATSAATSVTPAATSSSPLFFPRRWSAASSTNALSWVSLARAVTNVCMALSSRAVVSATARSASALDRVDVA